MATIKRPIKVYNGSSWDEIFPTTSDDMIEGLARHTGFKRTTDLINAPSGNALQWQSQAGDTNLIKWSSSKPEEFTVMKDGYYLIVCRHSMRHATGGYATLQLREYSGSEKVVGDIVVNMGVINGIAHLQFIFLVQLKSGNKLRFTTYWSGSHTAFMTTGSKAEFLRIGE